MEQYEVVQNIKCRDKAHAYQMWQGHIDCGGELKDIVVFRDGLPVHDDTIQREIEEVRRVKNQ